jgi:adenosylcobinamide kinase/adenosylcobinamide-phosphate guanylyltransferase
VDHDVAELASAVEDFTQPLALVSPEVGLTLVPLTDSGRRFSDELGTLNQRLAAVCDRVVLVVAGQPLTIKELR